MSTSTSIRSSVAMMAPYTKGHRFAIVSGIILGIIAVFGQAAALNVFGKFIDDVIVPADFSAFPHVAILYAVISVAMIASGCVSQVALASGGEGVVRSLRSELFRRIMSMPASFFDRNEPGDLLTRIDSDVDEVEVFAVSGIDTAANAVFQVVVFTGMLVWLDPELTLVALVIVPVVLIATKLLGRRMAAVEAEARRRASNLMGVAEQSVNGEADARAFGWVGALTRRFDEEGRHAQAAAVKETRVGQVLEAVGILAVVVAALAVIGFGVYQLSSRTITIGTLTIFLGFLMELYEPITDLGSLGASGAAAAVSAGRINEIFTAENTTPEPAAPGPAPATPTDLRFDAVTFSYPGRARVLDAVSFAVRPGEVVALVGDSGAGKSTIARLAHRAYDPSGGRVLLGGRDLRTLGSSTVTGNVAVVNQFPALLDTTIIENVRAARPRAGRDEVDSAIRAVGLDDVAAAFPEGLETQVGPHGRGLSGGQRERVAIARALLCRAPVLILDEPTNGLDQASVTDFTAMIAALPGDRAILLITHDQAVARCADRLLVLSHGRVAAQPTPTPLAPRRAMTPARLPRRALAPVASQAGNSSTPVSPPDRWL